VAAASFSCSFLPVSQSIISLHLATLNGLSCQALFFFGIVVNPVSIGHFTTLGSPQNGHVTPCGTSFALLYDPETVNVFLHFMQVMIFSIRTSLRG
jgi:hypothetical protein